MFPLVYKKQPKAFHNPLGIVVICAFALSFFLIRIYWRVGTVLRSFVFPKAPSTTACSLVGVHYIPVTSNGMNVIDFTFFKVDVIFSEILYSMALTNWPILSNISKNKRIGDLHIHKSF